RRPRNGEGWLKRALCAPRRAYEGVSNIRGGGHVAKPTSIAYSVAASVLVLSWLVVALPTAPVAAAVLVVATTNDAVNGDTSNPDALIANPGSDGISLREALAAANNAPGPHVITFAQTLAGATIAPASPLPPISRDHITLTGLTTSDGQPNITID